MMIKLTGVCGLGLFLMACQSQPTKVIKSPTSSQRTVSSTSAVTTQITTRQVPIIKSKDGVQDIHWTLVQVKFKKAFFFNQTPFLVLNSNSQRIQGHTGCNPIYGTYQVNITNKTISFDTKAGHMSCDNALSQEADLMDALARAQYFNINGNAMQIMDQNRQVLIMAEQR